VRRLCSAHRPRLLALLLAVATLAVYAPVSGYDFIDMDDRLYILDNEHVKSGLDRDGVVWALRSTESSNWHPLTWISHMLDVELYGLDAGGHHLTSLLLHLASTLLLFLLLERMTHATGRSACVAAFFALHPLHVESVAWVAERKDVLCGLLWMATLWCYVRYVEQPSARRYLAVIFIFGLCLSAKAMAVTLPCVLLLLDFWPLRRLRSGDSQRLLDPKRVGRAIGEKIPLLLLVLVVSIVTLRAQQHSGALGSVEAIPLDLRIWNALLAYLTYLCKMIWPSGLGVFYPHPGVAISWAHAIAAGTVLASVTFLVLSRIRSRPYLAVGWLWYLGTLVPVIGFVQVGGQALADRYTYLPLIGIFIIVAWGGEALLRSISRPWLPALTSIVAMCALAACTSLQLGHWRNSIALFEHTLAVTSDNVSIHYNLGTTLYSLERYEEAIPHFEEALRLSPAHVGAHTNLAGALDRLGRPAKAISHYHAAVRIAPDHANAHYNLGTLLTRRGRLDEAVPHLLKAVELEPGALDPRINLAAALGQRGQIEPAITQLAEVLRAQPGHERARRMLALVRYQESRGRPTEN